MWHHAWTTGDDTTAQRDRAGYRVRYADPELVQMMTSVGSQIGQFIERTRTEDALRQAREKLAQASRMAIVAELSATIAHEISQPLQALVANGQACRRWFAATPPTSTAPDSAPKPSSMTEERRRT